MSLPNQELSYYAAWWQEVFASRSALLVPAAVRAVLVDTAGMGFNADCTQGTTLIDALRIDVEKDKHLETRLPGGYHCQIQYAGEVVFDTREKILIAGDWEQEILRYTLAPAELKAEKPTNSEAMQVEHYKLKLYTALGKPLPVVPTFEVGDVVADKDKTLWIVVNTASGMVKVTGLHGLKNADKFAFQLTPAHADKVTRLTLVIDTLRGERFAPPQAQFVAQNAPLWLMRQVIKRLWASIVEAPYYSRRDYLKALKHIATEYDGTEASEWAWQALQMLTDAFSDTVYEILVDDTTPQEVEAL